MRQRSCRSQACESEWTMDGEKDLHVVYHSPRGSATMWASKGPMTTFCVDHAGADAFVGQRVT